MKTLILLIWIFSVIFLLTGCSQTSQLTTQPMLTYQGDQRFNAEVKKIAVQREPFFYYLGQTENQAALIRRSEDFNYQEKFGCVDSWPKEHTECIPLVIFSF